MVREANIKQATAEKQLREAQGKVSFSYLFILWPEAKRFIYGLYATDVFLRVFLSFPPAF